MAALRALIFDVDGTLAETEECHRQAFNQAFLEAGLDWLWDPLTYRDLLQITGGKERMRAYQAEIDAGGLNALMPRIPELHRRKTEIYNAMVASGRVPLRPGIATLIAEADAAGLRMGIATTTSMENVDQLLTVSLGPDWKRLLPVVIAGDMVPRKKPAPDVYLAALAALKVEAGEAVAIEDSGPGLASAKAAGLTVIVTPSQYFAQADFTKADLVWPVEHPLSLTGIRAAFGST